jgi:DNA (cytosine-5)-methyltransferase 1
MFTLRADSAHAVAIQAGALRENPDSGPDGVGVQEDIAYTIEARAEVQAVAYNITPSQSNKDYNARPTQRAQAITTTGNRPSARGGDVIAFGSKEYAQDAGDVSPPLRAMGHDESHQNGGGQVAIAFQTSGNCGAWETGDMVGALDTMTDPNSHIVQTQWAVRRLTPMECERLQGAPDEYTNIAYRGRNTIADGPRYKMIGNSFAVNCVRWIGERIQAVHDFKAAADASGNVQERNRSD